MVLSGRWATLHLLRYIKGIVNLGIVLGGKCDLKTMNLYAVADAAHDDVLGTRHSTGGHVVFLANAPIYWKSKKLPLIIISLTEAEFCNLTPTGKSLKWIAGILSDLKYKQPTP
jgi:hypothetical protein